MSGRIARSRIRLKPTGVNVEPTRSTGASRYSKSSLVTWADDLAAEAAVDLVLVDDEDAGRLPHRGGDGVEVERDERAQVDDLDLLPLLRERRRRPRARSGPGVP